jgi:predicted  nucleic acid-binding Zn-ribbon protein
VLRTRSILFVLIAVATAVGAGCGGGDDGRLSKAEYEQRMQAIGTELRTASSAIGDLSQTRDLDKLADTIADFRERLEEAADDVDGVTPPEDVEEETDKIAEALHAFADTFGEMEDAARDGDLAGLQQAQAEIASKGAEAQRATESLKQKGYEIGDLGAG